MRNLFRRRQQKAVVPPWGKDGEDVRSPLLDNQSSVPGSDRLKIKVRMTRRQLQELMARLDVSKADKFQSQLGRMILQECLEGNFRACVVNGEEGLAKSAGIGRKLSSIKEE